MTEPVPEPREDTSASPDPDPRTTPGLESGGGVAPGETPPASSSEAMSTAASEPAPDRSRAIPIGVLVLLALVSLAVVGFVAARAFALAG